MTYFLKCFRQSQALICAHGSVIKIKSQDSDLSFFLKSNLLESILINFLKNFRFKLFDVLGQFSQIDGGRSFKWMRILRILWKPHLFNPHGSLFCLDTNSLIFFKEYLTWLNIVCWLCSFLFNITICESSNFFTIQSKSYL